jgi:hypothetical protein
MDTTSNVLLSFLIITVLVAAGFGYTLYTNPPVILPKPEISDFAKKFGIQLIQYIPTVFFTFCFVSDIVTQQYNYIKPAIITLFELGILAFVGSDAFTNSFAKSFNSVSSFFRRNQNPAPAPAVQEAQFNNLNLAGGADVCETQGPLAFASNRIAPPEIIMSMTIIWYILIEYWDTGNTSHSMGIGITGLIVFAIQWFGLWWGDCLGKNPFNPIYFAGNFAPLLALVIAGAFASSGYYIIKSIPGSSTQSQGSGSSPSSAIFPFISGQCAPGTVLGVDGTCVPSSSRGVSVGEKSGANKSLPVNDQDQFVCEAYKDGELITSTMV